jgi:hypothetical protein
MLLAALGLSGCFGGSAPERPKSAEQQAGRLPIGGAVLYTIGVSTDPYGESSPHGFGVAHGLLGSIEKVEVRSAEYGWFGGAEWLENGQILVHRKAPPLRQPVIFRVARERLERSGFAPFISGSAYRWSAGHELLAVEPPAACKPGQTSVFACYRGSGRIVVTEAGRPQTRIVVKGTSPDWTRDGRLVSYRTQRDLALGRAAILDLASGRTTFRKRYWPNEEPLASADGRYLVARRQGKVVVTNSDGRLVREFPTPYIVSMVAWAPRGHRLAYTTSGFPDPHELFLVDTSTGKRSRIFVSGAPHFDWITWSPDGRWLLLDADEAGGWRVFSARTGEQVRLLPRLGGRPLWCCPVNRYDALSGRSG